MTPPKQDLYSLRHCLLRLAHLLLGLHVVEAMVLIVH